MLISHVCIYSGFGLANSVNMSLFPYLSIFLLAGPVHTNASSLQLSNVLASRIKDQTYSSLLASIFNSDW